MTMEKQWIPETGDWTRAGVTKTGQGVNFTLELPEAETAELLLFQKGEEEPEAVIPMGEKVMGDLCSIFLKGFRPERYELSLIHICIFPFSSKANIRRTTRSRK